MKLKAILAVAATMATPGGVHADECEFQKPEYTAVMKALGTPPIIDPVKPASGGPPVAVVWTYPDAAHGKDVSAILIDGRVQALVVDGEVES